MKKIILTILAIFFISVSCATTRDYIKVNQVIEISDKWWFQKKTENPHFYKEIDLGRVIFHFCGSRAKLYVEYNKRYPDTPFDLSSNVYMFTTSGFPIHVWLVVKIENKKIILHKCATGHEMVRVFTIISPNQFKNADKYE